MTIGPDVMPYIAELGFEAEFERMLQHVRANVPELVEIEVERYVRCYEEDENDGICITAVTARPWDEVIPIQKPIGLWRLTAFPPGVFTTFLIDVRSTRA
jgi:hypothetical protein